MYFKVFGETPMEMLHTGLYVDVLYNWVILKALIIITAAFMYFNSLFVFSHFLISCLNLHQLRNHCEGNACFGQR